MNRLFIATILIAVAGCTTASPKQFYRPIGAEQQLEISGRFNLLSYEHHVLINGESVISGDLPYNQDDASFKGHYGDASVTSDCHWKSKTDLSCLVKVNGEMAATLTF